MTEHFYGPKLKIQRAKRHVNNLHRVITRFQKRNPYRLVVEDRGHPGQYAGTLRIKEEMPEDIPLILGDAIHNLRATLDILTCDVVRLYGGDGAVTKQTKFPFCVEGGANDLDSVVKKRLVESTPEDVLTLFRNTKPYEGGNEALCVLHDLDIEDKHRTLISVVNVVEAHYRLGTIGQHVYAAIKDARFSGAQDGTVLMPLPRSGDFKISQEFDLPVDIKFRNVYSLLNESVVPALKNLTQLVEGIVQTFEAHCFGGK